MALLKKKIEIDVEVIKKFTIEKETEKMLKSISKMYGYNFESKNDLNEVFEELIKESLKTKVDMKKVVKEYTDINKITISEETALKLYEFASVNNYDHNNSEELSDLVNRLLTNTLNKDKAFKKYYETTNVTDVVETQSTDGVKI